MENKKFENNANNKDFDEMLSGFSEEDFRKTGIQDPNEDLRTLGKQLEQVYRRRKDEDYIINLPQALRFLEAATFFSEASQEDGAQLMTASAVPKEEHGFITAEFPVLYLCGEELKQFGKILMHAGALTIDATNTDKVCVSLNIPFVHQKNPEEMLQYRAEPTDRQE